MLVRGAGEWGGYGNLPYRSLDSGSARFVYERVEGSLARSPEFATLGPLLVCGVQIPTTPLIIVYCRLV